jgi:hypothetical protein
MATIPHLLRPDMKSVVWLLIGALAVPMVMRKLR